MVCSTPQPMWDITIHPLQGPASLLTLFPSSNRCGTAPKSTPFGAQRPYWHIASCLLPLGNSKKADTSFGGTSPSVYSLWGTARRLAHRLVSGSDTIFNTPNSPLADIVLFGFSLFGYPQGFKTRLGEGFHTLINRGLFPSQSMWDITLNIKCDK